jgi:hypothetical protein
MPRAQKVGVFVLFGSGFVCIAFATLRVIQIGIDGRGKTTTPEPKWMLLWTILECSIGKHRFFYLQDTYRNGIQLIHSLAIIIGCSPAFAIFIRKRINKSKKRSYNAEGYLKQPTNEDIKLKSILATKSQPKRNNTNVYWEDEYSSQEELAQSVGRIAIGTTLHQEDEHSSNIAGAL